MATSSATSKLRRRTFDRLRQKLWAIPAHLRLRVARRGTVRPRAHRSTSIR